MGTPALPLWICCCSPSFMPLLSGPFYESIETTGLSERWEFHVVDLPETYPNFGEQGADAAGRLALREVHGILAREVGRTVVFSGVDFRFYRDFTDELLALAKPFDLVASCDRHAIGEHPAVFCTDFQCFTVTPAVLAFWAAWCDSTGDAQIAFNHLLREHKLNATVLPDAFWSVGLGGVPRPWEPGDALPEPPTEIALQHGNFTLGLDHKLALLAAVALRVKERASPLNLPPAPDSPIVPP